MSRIQRQHGTISSLLVVIWIQWSSLLEPVSTFQFAVPATSTVSSRTMSNRIFRLRNANPVNGEIRIDNQEDERALHSSSNDQPETNSVAAIPTTTMELVDYAYDEINQSFVEPFESVRRLLLLGMPDNSVKIWLNDC